MISDASAQRSKSTTAKRELIILGSVAVALLIVAASLYWYYYADRAGTQDHHYYVKVEANTTEEYLIRLPVPVNESGTMPPYFVQDIEVLVGNPVFALGESDHGTYLEVRASGYVEFEWVKGWPDTTGEVYGNLTMTTGAEGWDDHGPALSWIFSDRPDIRINLLHSSIHNYMSSPTWASGGGPTFSFNDYPNGTGWQQVGIDYGWMVIN